MKVKHVGFTIEVLQDQGMGSTGTVTKFCVIDAPLKCEGRAGVRDEMLYKSVQGISLLSKNLQESTDTYT